MSKNEKPIEKQRHIESFEVWYRHERSFEKTHAELGVTKKSLFEWANKFDWRARADARDEEMLRLREKDAMKRQKALLDKQRQAAELLRMRGVECFMDAKSGRITDHAKAIKAIQVGIELGRQAEDLPTWMLEIVSKTDEELAEERDRLLRLARIEAGRSQRGDEPEEDEGEDEIEEE
jgi:hypothetical protein